MIEIIKGWSNFFLGLEGAKAKAKAIHCISCDFFNYTKYEVFKDDEIKEISGAFCEACKCPLSAKLRSNDKCPIKKF